MLFEFLGADSRHVVKNLLEKRVLRIPFLPGTERNPPTQVRVGCNLSHANSKIHVDGAGQAAPTKSDWNGEKTSAQLWRDVMLLSDIGTHRVGTPNPTGPLEQRKTTFPSRDYLLTAGLLRILALQWQVGLNT